ncbi:MAG: hypothetical protein FWD40_01660 [Treponema sp.]|nr:hypothetical protein [Treponema sp.]
MKQIRKRLFIDVRTNAKEREKLIKLAVENECNTLVFSFNDSIFKGNNKNLKYMKLARHYALNIEAGGHDLSLLLPKSLFLFNRDLFRMEQGKRKMSFHFCPTNPKTTAIISKRAHRLFGRVLQTVTVPRFFHLLPENNHESTWCQCPACRAFRPAEQYLIAVNAAADELAKYDHEAQLLYVDFDTEPEAARVKPRKNMCICSYSRTPAL